MSSQHLKFNRQFFKDLWQLTKPYWTSSEKWIAWGLLTLNILCSIIEVRASVAINGYNKNLFDALQAFNTSGLMSALWHIVIAIVILIVVFGYGFYFNSLLSFRWRRWLTTVYIKKWLDNHTHYRMQVLNKNIDNPDQRISEDLAAFPGTTLSLSFMVFQALLTLVSFSIILWGASLNLTIPIGKSSITIYGYLFWIAVIYALIGTWITRWIGKTLAGLNYQQQQFNADFRFSLIRLREASEQIALYRGESAEDTHCQNLFSRIFKNFLTMVNVQKRLNFFTMGYNTTSSVFGFVITMPLYLAKKIQLGTVMQVSGAFGNVISSFSIFINSFNSFADWRAVIYRLTEFSKLMDGLQSDASSSKIIIENHDHPDIVINNLDLHTPDGKAMLDKINLVLHSGNAVLINGPSGIGKSTLLRALAGLWPHGKGKIHIPENAKTIFLPQKPYFPLGTLENALLYPHHPVIEDNELQSALELCGLIKFKDKLNDVNNWSHELSLGEQQLIAFARVFINKPDIIFLDEATSALDEKTEADIYEKLRLLLPKATIISVGHRSSIHKYHERQISFPMKPDELVLES